MVWTDLSRIFISALVRIIVFGASRSTTLLRALRFVESAPSLEAILRLVIRSNLVNFSLEQLPLALDVLSANRVFRNLHYLSNTIRMLEFDRRKSQKSLCFEMLGECDQANLSKLGEVFTKFVY
jgi:nanoRNase/pAp phosphatase (c-di-AMP/oligoRNAs hydrolase)